MRRSFLTENSQSSLVTLEKSVNDILTNIELYKNCEALKIQRIDNPAKEFVEAMNRGYFDEMGEAEVADIAEIANCQSDAVFGMEPYFSTNYVKTLYDLNQTLLDVRQQISNLMALDLVSLSMQRCENEIKARQAKDWDNIDDLSDESNEPDPIAKAAEQMDVIHDDVFGDMEYDYGYRRVEKMELPCNVVPGCVKDSNRLKYIFDVVADAFKGQPITNEQKSAWLEFVEMVTQNREHLSVKIPEAVLDYYLNHVVETESKEVTVKDVMAQVKIKTLYFDRKGKYGFLCDCKWDEEHGICIVLSEDTPFVAEQDYLI